MSVSNCYVETLCRTHRCRISCSADVPTYESVSVFLELKISGSPWSWRDWKYLVSSFACSLVVLNGWAESMRHHQFPMVSPIWRWHLWVPSRSLVRTEWVNIGCPQDIWFATQIFKWPTPVVYTHMNALSFFCVWLMELPLANAPQVPSTATLGPKS